MMPAAACGDRQLAAGAVVWCDRRWCRLIDRSQSVEQIAGLSPSNGLASYGRLRALAGRLVEALTRVSRRPAELASTP